MALRDIYFPERESAAAAVRAARCGYTSPASTARRLCSAHSIRPPDVVIDNMKQLVACLLLLAALITPANARGLAQVIRPRASDLRARVKQQQRPECP